MTGASRPGRDAAARIDGAEAADPWDDQSFLVAPGCVADWRLVVLFDAAEEAGVLSHLPGRPADLAARLDLDAHATRVVLEALAAWGVVEAADDGSFVRGPQRPGAEEALVMRHHARSLRAWSSTIDHRLSGVTPPAPAGPRAGSLERWLDALAVNARRSAPAAVDACLRRVADARSVLDLGGGHGEYALEFHRRGLEATMQDRPEVIELARSRGRLEEGGVRLFAGDFFRTLPEESFDVVFLAGVSYTYDGPHNAELCRRVKPLVAPGGALAVHTFLRGRDALSAIFAVQMLMVGTGGDTHAEEDHRRWFGEAGYRAVEVVHLDRSPESLLLARP